MGSTVAAAAIHVSLEPDSAVVQPGDTVTVKLTVFQAESEFNAFDAYVQFDPTRLQFVPASSVDAQIGVVMTKDCNNFFHQFLPYSDHLEIHLSLLCNNTFETGPGVVYQVRFLALAVAGSTQLTWLAGTEFYRAGFFVRPVEALPMTLFVGGIDSVEPHRAGGAVLSLATPRPNPWRGSGAVTLAFSLPGPERVGFVVLDTQGRRVAERAPEEFGVGMHSIAWSGLRLTPGRYVVEMAYGAGAGAARAWVVTR
jgi:hypothetical protein